MTQSKSRIHILAARAAPTVVILQRKRAKLFHVITVHVTTHRMEQGSWFRGKLYPLRCDLSFDGKLMVYLAMGASGKTWNGLCRPPWLTTLIDTENMGTWFGGGYFADRRLLKTNGWSSDSNLARVTGKPLTLEPYRSRYGGEDLGVLYERLERDGFTRVGDNWGKDKKLPTLSYKVARIGDQGWRSKPSRKHPELKLRYVGYLTHGRTFEFSLDAYPELLEGATWATWDSIANLWVARPGVVEQFTINDLKRGKPSFSLDVDQFEPPAPTSEAASPASAASTQGTKPKSSRSLRVVRTKR